MSVPLPYPFKCDCSSPPPSPPPLATLTRPAGAACAMVCNLPPAARTERSLHCYRGDAMSAWALTTGCASPAKE